MPCLSTKSPRKDFELHRRITSLGPHPANNIVVAGENQQDTYAQIHLQNGSFVISTIDRKISMTVNHKRVKKHSLDHGDKVVIEGVELEFNLWAHKRESTASRSTQEDLISAYRRLENFSQRLGKASQVDQLLDVLMDQIIEISGADKGFLVLKDGDRLSIQSARNIQNQTLEAQMTSLSDSILQRVLETKQPLIVSDALNDSEFKESASVMDLKLCSVICAPLIVAGEIYGVIYLGNDNVVNLFTPQSLDILSVFSSQAALLLTHLIATDALRTDNAILRDRIDLHRYGSLIGSSLSMQKIFDRIDKIASANVSVLILGETGTGKELVAREIHKRSTRAEQPFIAVNCGALPEALMESEIFGHKKGAFTGAISDKKGVFQAANGGTLFLDEIGDMPLKLQVKLLRAIQERKITRVGDLSPIDIDIRLITATHIDLDAAITNGRFREDLYYRINVVGLSLPPLRDREDDVLKIADYLLEKYGQEFQKARPKLNSDCKRQVLKYPWPGNIRELENRLRKAALLADNPTLTPEDLELTEEMTSHQVLPLAQAKEEFQREYIDRALALNNNNRTKTAEELEVDPRTIFRHLERYRQNS